MAKGKWQKANGKSISPQHGVPVNGSNPGATAWTRCTFTICHLPFALPLVGLPAFLAQAQLRLALAGPPEPEISLPKQKMRIRIARFERDSFFEARGRLEIGRASCRERCGPGAGSIVYKETR